MSARRPNPSARQTDAEAARIRGEQGEAARALLTAHDAADLLELLGIAAPVLTLAPADVVAEMFATLEGLDDGPGFYEHTDRAANIASDEAEL